MSNVDFDLSYPFPILLGLAKLLMTLVEISEQDNVLIVDWDSLPSPDSYAHHDFTFSGGSSKKEFRTLSGKEINSLHMMGLIEILGDRKQLFLPRDAFDWVKYQRMGKIKRWSARTSIRTRDLVYGATAALTFVLAICRILEFTK